MRLDKVAHGHGLGARVKLSLIGLMSGKGGAPDVVRAVMYRPRFWGAPQSALFQKVMRGPSEWSVGERELFAAFVSRKNQCPF